MVTIFQGFLVFILFQAFGVYFFGRIFTEIFSDAPNITINMLSSSAISPVIACVFISMTNKYIPKHIFNRESIVTTVAGIISVWVICLVQILIYGPQNTFIKLLLSAPSLYCYINVFWFIMWGPFIEETFFRGYIYELMRSKSEALAILMSSALFTLPHIMFSSLTIDYFIALELLFIFIRSIVFTYTYRQGGLLASIAVHSFANIYFLFLNHS